MSRKFTRAKVPLGRFTATGARPAMFGHRAFIGVDRSPAKTDPGLIHRVHAARQQRVIDPTCSVEPFFQAPSSPSPNATRGLLSKIAAAFGAGRRSGSSQ